MRGPGRGMKTPKILLLWLFAREIGESAAQQGADAGFFAGFKRQGATNLNGGDANACGEGAIDQSFAKPARRQDDAEFAEISGSNSSC